MPTTTGRLV